IRLRGGNLADEDVAPANLAAVRLKLDRGLAEQRLLAVPEVLQPGVNDDELVVEKNGDALADLQDAEVIPQAEWLVGVDDGVLAGAAGTVVPQPAAPLVRA